jgi:CBS domain-containing protein
MRVEEVMTRRVHSCRPEDTLARAAQLMWDHDCGCLPVLGSNGAERVVGMVTDRDICMCALFESSPLSSLRVSRAMAKQVHACQPYDSLADAERVVMREARVRRLPVVDESDALVGMISLADVAQAAERGSSAERAEITPLDVAATFAEISRALHRELIV